MSIKEHKQFFHYSDSQKQQARDSDIIEFLNIYEGFTFHRAGSGYKCDQHNSLVVNANKKLWYWNSTGLKGSGTIDYLINVHGKTYLEAMDIIIGKGRAEIKTAPIVQKPETKELQLPEKGDEGKRRVYAYLMKSRGIAQNVIDLCVNEKSIYQDKMGNAVFVGFDDDNNPKFACVRGTLSEVQYRGDCSGSDKAYPFKISGTSPERLYVFESPIDLLSYITISQKNCPDVWKKHNYISLSGTSDVALESYLERNKNVTSIIFCLDNDKAGNELSEEYIKKYSDKGYNALRKAPKEKDFNDDLKKSFQQNKKEGEAVIITRSFQQQISR